ncbi:hypothetical protein M406DRAFT_248376 [Cryphonectria parasitica EP155]|uniref:Uncharacterized protein n=1 Tax=Cryphonectria parasitica (strain ATCC 38755 / EP155) TaxID=660469 RepID=A0A9P4YA23_CRYP1|nr:uncharacterized protein M406DRAFT_248376 [Cryphonectria parasitica EP155]KAF3769764.1 hypothetical protein M406DRAFT_248376 [Cryphonectria parasitica EP155]
MASGLFVDPATLLRLTPLISSTCTLWFAWDQRVMYGTFAHRDLEEQSKAILPLWWKKVLEIHDIERVLFPLTVTSVTSIINIRKYGSLLRAKGSWAWYAAGAALAVGHLAFVPGVVYKIKAMIDDNGKGEAVEQQRRWLTVHTLRTLTVDLGAWVACVIAVARTVSD